MADTSNQSRAMRIAEVIADFRNIQLYLASIRVNPSAGEYNEEGYVVLRQCAADAQSLLSQPFNTEAQSPHGDEEQERMQLRQVLLDASVRRFRAQRIYLHANAALQWVNSRNAILGGHQPQPVHQPALQQILNTLRAKISMITPESVQLSLRSMDASQGRWIAEDPDLGLIQQMIRSDR